MDLTPLIADDDAVSPVIGVILMVAVTVILAAVIGAFVLGIGSQVTEATPSVNVEIDNTTSEVTITHEGGESVEYDKLSVNVGGNSVDATDSSVTATGSQFTAGESITVPDSAVGGSFSSGDEVLLIYTTDGESTAILAEGEIP